MGGRRGPLVRRVLRAALPAVALVLIASASCSPEAREPVVGTWTLTGAMNEPRSQYALTPLSDGRVLAAGGCDSYSDPFMGCTALATAEVYDPVTGIWTSTGSMNEARRNYGAALLPDGRVLVAGGCSGVQLYGCRATAEVYDPASGRWTSTGEMARPRSSGESNRSMVVLPTGKVLFVGGYEPDFGAVTSGAEIYDPASGAWGQTAPMKTPRAYPSAVLLPSGKVLVVGGMVGMPPHQYGTESAETYDPEKNEWTETGSLDRAVVLNTLTLLPTGEVLLTNGLPWPAAWPPTAEADIYDPVEELWRPAHSMHLPRYQVPSAVRLASGRVLVAGGNYIDRDELGRNAYMALQGEIYDPWLDTWTMTPVMRHYVLDHGATALLPSGDGLYAGGLVYNGLGRLGETQFAISASQVFSDGPVPEVSP